MTKRPQIPGDFIASQMEAARPLAKFMGLFNREIRESFQAAEKQLDVVKNIMHDMETFSKIYSPLGWAIYDRISTDVVSSVVNLSVENGEEKLSEYHLSDSNLSFLRHRFKTKEHIHWLDLYDRSVERAQSGDFISSIPISLIILDGIFLNATGKHPFSGGAEAPIFDSQASRPGGLPEILAIIGSTRRKLSTDPITSPFRHGIIHGLNPNYGNRLSAAKSFNLLQAGIDYIDRRRDEAERLTKVQEDQAPLDVREILSTLRKNAETREQIDKWCARDEVKNKYIACSKSASKFEPGSPEEAAALYLGLVVQKNFGKVAHLTIDFPNRSISYRAGRIRDQLKDISVTNWKITGVKDLSPAMSTITTELEGEHCGSHWNGRHYLRLMFADTNFESLVRGQQEGSWAVMPDFLTGILGVAITFRNSEN